MIQVGALTCRSSHLGRCSFCACHGCRRRATATCHMLAIVKNPQKLSGLAQPNTTSVMLGRLACLQIPGCLTRQEAEKFVAAAESAGFQHSTSRGPAYGEVRRCGRPCS